MIVFVKLLKSYWLHIAVFAVVIGAGAFIYNAIDQRGYDRAEAKWQKLWSDQELKLERDKAEAERLQRRQEQAWQTKLNEAQRNADQRIEALETDLAAADSSAASLQQYAREMAKRASKSCPGTGANPGGETAETAAMVLAELLARADQAAGELAEVFDRSRDAGLTCEEAYDSLVNK